MLIFPAIDLYGGKAVRLYKGDYAQMTVYNENPVAVAKQFEKAGATWVHLVDLAGAKQGQPVHFNVVQDIVSQTGLQAEIGGGIRNMQTVDTYIHAGAARVIIGTAAVQDEEFLKAAIEKYGDKIAVGADVADGKIAIKGWLEKSAYSLDEFLQKMVALGVKTIICTDVSKDGAMKGANVQLYKTLTKKYPLQVIASGGVSSMDDVRALAKDNVYGAIIGKAYYIGAIDLQQAIQVAK